MARRQREPGATVDEQLAALDEIPTERNARIAALQRALAERHYRVAAKAARLAEDALLYELVPTLVAAFLRFLDKPLKSDPSCFAKKAIARALVALDCEDFEFFRRGIALKQLEPVWGGTTDTAVDVRASCAMGLVASGYSRSLVELTALLHDSEPLARAGAVRAIACGNAREAEVLLRSKALGGDPEPQVLGECFTGLLGVAPDESLDFVAAYLAHDESAVRELAALALGESRHAGALVYIKGAWNGVLLAEEFRRALLRAAAAHRSEAAFGWLLEVAADARIAVALEVVDALAIYRRNAMLKTRLDAVIRERGDRELADAFESLWH